MGQMVFSLAFILGFEHAAESLGREGDYRHVDWSKQYKFLKHKLGTLTLDVDGEIDRLTAEIQERQQRLDTLKQSKRK